EGRLNRLRFDELLEYSGFVQIRVAMGENAGRAAPREGQRDVQADARRAFVNQNRFLTKINLHVVALCAYSWPALSAAAARSFSCAALYSKSTRPSIVSSFISSSRGTFTFKSRIEQDTTSTISRLLAPISTIERAGLILSS